VVCQLVVEGKQSFFDMEGRKPISIPGTLLSKKGG